MNRRSLFSSRRLASCLIVVIACIPGFVTTAAESIFPEMPGMVSYTYRNQLSNDVEGTLDKIRDLGIKDMEFSNLFSKSAAELRKMLDERDMFCSSLGVSFDDVQNKTDEVAANAKTLGAKYVRVAWVPHKAPFSLEFARQTAEVFNRVGKELLEKHGLHFCYHNHGYEFVPYEDGTLFDVLMQETDPKYVSIELDILWVHFPGADPVAMIEKYGDRIPLLHLKDLKKGVQGDLSGKTPVENDVALGTGQIDLPRVLMAAKKAGVKHYYIEDESPSIDTQVPQSIEYLKNLTTDSLK
ncbi:MAG TPA: sugar phosphate isomerase [Planctomycetaceae bacterium]|nr:sugar phosphate isomerase [Planctomycetaceae bacterium]